MANVAAAGILEKCSRWRKDWSHRFFVLRRDRIDYYLEPPADVEDEPRGTIPLREAIASEEIGRPWCIQVGNVLLSCASRAEQQKWLENLAAANAARNLCAPAAHCSGRTPVSSFGSDCDFGRRRAYSGDSELQTSSSSSSAEPALLLLQATEEKPKPLRWHEPTTVEVDECGAVMLLLSSAGARSHYCRLPLFDAPVGRKTFAVGPLSESAASSSAAAGDGGTGAASTSGGCVRGNLEVEIHASCGPMCGEGGPSFATYAFCCLALAAALTAKDGSTLAFVAVVLAAVAFAMEAAHASPRRGRTVTFSAERLTSDAAGARSDDDPLTVKNLAAALRRAPRAGPLWVGRWTLDKALSQPYEPILADMGMTYLLRKAIDAKTSVLALSVGPHDVVINVRTLVTVEDTLPLDGSWVEKPAPPGTKYKGMLRMRIVRHSDSELVLSTDIPDQGGSLVDTTTVHADGLWFTRRTERFAQNAATPQIVVSRVFRRTA